MEAKEIPNGDGVQEMATIAMVEGGLEKFVEHERRKEGSFELASNVSNEVEMIAEKEGDNIMGRTRSDSNLKD